MSQSCSPSTCPFLRYQWRGLAALLAPTLSRLRFLVRFKGLRFGHGCVLGGRAGVRIGHVAFLCSRGNRGYCGMTYIHRANSTRGVIILFTSKSTRGKDVDTAAETSLSQLHHTTEEQHFTCVKTTPSVTNCDWVFCLGVT